MILIFIIILVVIILLNIIKTDKEQYNHVSPYYPSNYISECKCLKPCINSRCIYATLNECKKKCGKACIFCPDGMYMCGDNQ